MSYTGRVCLSRIGCYVVMALLVGTPYFGSYTRASSQTAITWSAKAEVGGFITKQVAVAKRFIKCRPTKLSPVS